MDENTPQKVHVSDLSGEAHFAWAFHLAEQAELALAGKGATKRLTKRDELANLELVRDFYAAMREAYGITSRNDVQMRKRLWLDDYLKGIHELADHGLVRLQRNAEGSYDVVEMVKSRLVGGEITMATGGGLV